MSRYFSALTDRISAPQPAVWPEATGSIFLKIKPAGWASGTGTAHGFCEYGYFEGGSYAVLDFVRYSDNRIYAGWAGDAAHGGEQRIIIPDAGCFADGVWANHLLTWDQAAGQQYYFVDNVQKGVRAGGLTTETLSGNPASQVTIGNVNAANANTDARGTLAFFARWNRVLMPAERAQLQSGAHPLDLPTGLVECIDLGAATPEQDLLSRTVYTVTGASVGNDPMRRPAEIRELSKKFEPILLFHPAETFLPIDPKWYLEQCALWRAAPPDFTDKANWGEPPRAVYPHGPQLSKFKIAALAGETFTGGTWLGDDASDFEVGTAPDQEAPPRPEERFLQFVGWNPVVDPPVAATSVNRHPTFNPVDYTAPLAASRPWYYVEHLDHDDLLAYAAARRPNGLSLHDIVAANPSLNNPSALLYYFLYPLHQEALENCEEREEGATFATYAGEWGCIAILLDGNGAPRFIGLTSRNVGAPSVAGADDKRVGMTVYPWTAVSAVGNHPKIFVSLGTHGHYPAAGPQAVTPFSGGNDVSTGSCGAVEAADGEIAEDIVIPGYPGHNNWPTGWLVVAKGLLIVVGWIWAAHECATSDFGTGDQLTNPTPPTDQTGGPTFGKIIRPDGLTFAETAGAASVVDWQVNRYTAADTRVYDSIVSRPAQVWWTPRRQDRPRFEGPGWFGRWGPRVTNDPFNRRAGGKCPDFLELFLEAIAIALN